MNDRNYLVEQLCYQILHMRYDEQGKPLGKPHRGIEQVATGDVRLDLEIKGMVMGMRKQLWMDQGAWTSKIVAEIERKAAEIDVGAIIAKRVSEEVSRTVRDLEQLVAKKVDEYITSAVYDRVESLRNVVRDIADAMIKRITKVAI